MPKQFLYHITPTRNLPSIAQVGIEPRSGEWRGIVWTPRAWLATNISAAYLCADIFLFECRYGCSYDDPVVNRKIDHYWEADGKHGVRKRWIEDGLDWRPNARNWRMIRNETLSIIRIDQAKAPAVHPNDLGDFHRLGSARDRRRATVWADTVIRPDAFIEVKEVDQSYLISPAYRRYVGSDARGTAAR